MRIGLVSATEKESGIILGRLRKVKTKKTDPSLYRGRMGRNEIIHVISGIGKTNASHSATLLIERFSSEIVMNFGIGGAYPSSGLRIGDLAVADKEIYGDEGLLLKDGFHTTDAIGLPLLKKNRQEYFNEFTMDKGLVRKAVKFFKLTPKPYSLSPGCFITVSTCTGTNKRAKELEKKFGGICENMEGAAIAHICAIYGIPFLEIRGISNIVEDRDKKKWDIQTASENCQRAVLEFLESVHASSNS